MSMRWILVLVLAATCCFALADDHSGGDSDASQEASQELSQEAAESSEEEMGEGETSQDEADAASDEGMGEEEADTAETANNDGMGAEETNEGDAAETASDEGVGAEEASEGDVAQEADMAETPDDEGMDEEGEGHGHDADPVILALGEVEIRREEFDQRFQVFINNLAASQGVQMTEDLFQQLQPLKTEYLSQLSMDVVLFVEAQARGHHYPDEDLDAQIADMKSNFPSDDDFLAAMQLAGFRDEAQMSQLLYEVETIGLLIEALEAEAAAAISDEDVEAFYQENSDTFQASAEVCARHILVESEEEALEIRGELEAGADFAAMAVSFSIGPSGRSGGDLDGFSGGMMVPPVE